MQTPGVPCVPNLYSPIAPMPEPSTVESTRCQTQSRGHGTPGPLRKEFSRDVYRIPNRR